MSSPRPTPTRKQPASLARRAAPAVVLTASGLALLLQLDRPSSLGGASDQLAVGLTNAAASTAPTAPGAQPPATLPPATQAPATQAPATAAPAPAAGGGRPSASPKPPATKVAPSTTAAAASGQCLQEIVKGPVVQTRWGPVQVAARFTAAGHLCAIDAVQTPNDARNSVVINSYAVPRLNAEALQAGAQFDAISGATVTSEGYRRSLQALLDSR